MTMTMIDATGHTVTGATAAAVALRSGAHEMRCLIGDPVATIERALAEAPAMSMAHMLRAWLHLLGTEPPALAVAREAAEAAARHAGNAIASGRMRAPPRSSPPAAGARPRAAGGPVGAAPARPARAAGRPPDRLLHRRFAHAARPHRARAAAVGRRHARLPCACSACTPSASRRPATRRRPSAPGAAAVELEPRDSWAWHAVAHVHRDAQCAAATASPGSSRMRRTGRSDSFLAVHNWWHLALFQLEQDRHDEVLALYDASIGGPGSGVVLDMIDPSALLWRLAAARRRTSATAGSRWPSAGRRMRRAGNYAFNDLHAMMAFVERRPQRSRQRSCCEAQRAALAGDGDDNAAFTREVGAGRDARRAGLRRGRRRDGRRAAAADPRIAHRFGGSHAQRDLIDLTLIEAALRGGDRPLAAALAAERARDATGERAGEGVRAARDGGRAD